jgi:hypothetical protein
MEHQDLVFKLCLIESEGEIKSYTKNNLDNLVKRFKSKKTDTESHIRYLRIEAKNLLEKVKTNINRLSEYFELKDSSLRYKGIIIIYYLFLKNENPSKNLFKKFISAFENARAINRKHLIPREQNATLLQFDRLNQQGAYQSQSTINRLKIFYFYFNHFKEKGLSYTFKDEMKPVEIGIKQIEREE